MEEKGRKKGGEAKVFLMTACQYTNVERILSSMQQWIQTKFIFAVRDIRQKEGLMNGKLFTTEL